MAINNATIILSSLALLLAAIVGVSGWLVKAILSLRVQLARIETDTVNFRAEINKRWDDRVAEIDGRCERRMTWLKETYDTVVRLDKNIIKLAATLAPNLKLETE